MADTNLFEHEPIDYKRYNFRLLRLKGLQHYSSMIQCELYPSDFVIDNPSYEALSYTWGDPERVGQIVINEKEHWVTKSLLVALGYLRQDQDRVLWVDALCIDQESATEKNEQVPQMRRIYQNAKRVVFWLGEATFEAKVLMRSLMRLRPLYDQQQQVNQERWERCWSLLRLTAGDMSLCRLGLLTLLRRSWFERMWVIQEVSMAKDAVVQSSAWCVRAQVFALAAALIHVNPPERCIPILQSMPGQIDHPIAPRRHNSDLFNLMSTHSKSKATNPRDRVYALMGLCDDNSDDNSDATYGVTIDYTKPVDWVLQDVFTRFVRSKHLNLVQILNLMKDYPDANYVCTVVCNTLEIVSVRRHSNHVLDMRDGDFLADVANDVAAITVHVESYDSGSTEQYQSLDTRLRAHLDDTSTSRQEVNLLLFGWESANSNTKVMFICFDLSVEEDFRSLSRFDSCPKLFNILFGTYKDHYTPQRLEDIFRCACDPDAHRIGTPLGLCAALIHHGISDSIAIALDTRQPLSGRPRLRDSDLVVTSQLILLATDDANTQYNKDTALHRFSAIGSVAHIRALLDLGAHPDSHDRARVANLELVSPLVAAAHQYPQDDTRERINLLLEAGADINAYTPGHMTALMWCVLWSSWGSSTHGAAAELLVHKGANVHIYSGSHGTAFDVAVSNDNNAMMMLLMKNGADIHGHFDFALHAACATGDHEIVRQILHYDINVDVTRNIPKFRVVDDRQVKNRSKPYTAFQAAAMLGHRKVMELLLDHGADINLSGGPYGSTLQATASTQPTDGHNPGETVRFLIRRGAEVDLCGGKFGSALHAAVSMGNEEVIMALLQGGANININSDQYSSPLHTLVNAKDHPGDPTARFKYIAHKRSIVRLLIDHGADVNLPDTKTKQTPLQSASGMIPKLVDREVVELLLTSGADVNARGGPHCTALFAALHQYNHDIVQILIKHGADVNARNEAGRSVLDMATNSSIRQLLIDSGARSEKEEVLGK